MSVLRSDLELLNGDHGTRWGNLGDWSAAERYPEACAALAQRLGEAAGLGPGDRVLDCGVGAGEQLAVWIEGFDVASVVGLELLADQVQLARTRARALGDRVRVTQGSATQLPFDAPAFDAVLALDCAYHFRPRARFFAEAARCAEPGARLVLTDVVLRPRAPRALRAASRWLGIPAVNLLTRAGYVAELEAAGWTLTRFEPLDAEVLGGFARFALGPMRRAAWRRPFGGWPKVLATGLGCRWAVEKGWLHYALVAAERA